MQVRLLGLGLAEFAADSWNIFDAILVGTSAIELLEDVNETTAEEPDANFTPFRALRMLRLLRVLRMLRMMRFLRGVQRICECLLGSLRQVSP